MGALCIGFRALSARISHEDLAFVNGRLAHERIAQPFLPNDFPGFFIDDEDGAAFGVESHIAVFDNGGGGAIIAGWNFPAKRAGICVEGVKLVRSITATYKDQSVSICGGGNWPAAGNAQHPSGFAVSGAKANRLQDGFGLRQTYLNRLTEIDL